MRPLLLALVLVPWLAAGAASRADDPVAAGPEAVGKVAAAEGQVEALQGRDARAVEAGEAVYRGDWIETGDDGRAQIVLHDETELVVGPGSRVHLDEFVYDPGGGSGKLLVEMGEGLLRFTTGVLAPESYEVKTPVASIGVRGTVFDVLVSAVDFATTVILRQGGPLVIRSLVDRTVLETAGQAARAVRSDEPPGDPRDPSAAEETASKPLREPFHGVPGVRGNRGPRRGPPDGVTKPRPDSKPPLKPPPIPRGKPEGPPRMPNY